MEAMETDRTCPPSVPDDPRELDYLYNEADRVYYGFARLGKLSSCTYWMMYDIERAGGETPLSELTESWAYSKQTISSALKTLEARGLISLSFVEGSRQKKIARFTEDGRAFSARYVVPAMQAERRAFCSLPVEDRAALLRTARAYTEALTREFEQAEGLFSAADTPQGAQPAS